jgi:hypothetical protein
MLPFATPNAVKHSKNKYLLFYVWYGSDSFKIQETEMIFEFVKIQLCNELGIVICISILW